MSEEIAAAERGSRRQQILQALAGELESHPGARITTARLARVVGVSEAALYRHFPSKAKMFEALLAFAEDSVFGLANRVLTVRELRQIEDRELATRIRGNFMIWQHDCVHGCGCELRRSAVWSYRRTSYLSGVSGPAISL